MTLLRHRDGLNIHAAPYSTLQTKNTVAKCYGFLFMGEKIQKISIGLGDF